MTVSLMLRAPVRATGVRTARAPAQRAQRVRAAAPWLVGRPAPASLPRRRGVSLRAAGGGEGGEESLAQLLEAARLQRQALSDEEEGVVASSSAAEAAAGDAEDGDAESNSMPLADLTLRAEADGACARVHRGVLAYHSRVIDKLLRDTPTTHTIVLLGKSKAELELLVAWLYRNEQFSTVRCALCAAMRQLQFHALRARR
jgi:hypothetical protein